MFGGSNIPKSTLNDTSRQIRRAVPIPANQLTYTPRITLCQYSRETRNNTRDQRQQRIYARLPSFGYQRRIVKMILNARTSHQPGRSSPESRRLTASQSMATPNGNSTARRETKRNGNEIRRDRDIQRETRLRTGDSESDGPGPVSKSGQSVRPNWRRFRPSSRRTFSTAFTFYITYTRYLPCDLPLPIPRSLILRAKAERGGRGAYRIVSNIRDTRPIEKRYAARTAASSSSSI